MLDLRYWEWGNVPEKIRNEFHAKDATIAKRDSKSLSFYWQGSSKISQKTHCSPPLNFIGRYSLIPPWRPLRPLRENIIFESTHCKQRRA
jgi:hypothetical protein